MTEPVAAVEASFERIGTSRAENVWITLRSTEDVLDDAHDVERHISAEAPLYGRTFAVKDNIDVVGLPTTAGCPEFAYEPASTATVVDRLREAGAVLIGKTNLDQFATGLVGTRSPYGACHNVFDPRYISGGSSSGSAVAVAEGQVDFALGTDTAGSGRVPAACNGIIGLKPTRGLMSMAGVVPACLSFDCMSFFTRTLADAQLVLDAAAGFDQNDAGSRRAPEADLSETVEVVGVADLDQLEEMCDQPTLDGFAAVRERLDASGTKTLQIDLDPLLEAGSLLYGGAFVAERYAAVGGFVDAHPDAVDPTVRSIISAAGGISGAEVFRDQRRLAELRRAGEPLWEEVQALVLPTVPRIPTLEEVAADPIGVNRDVGTYTQFVNLLDLCAVVVPTGRRPDGLPLSASIVGPAFTEPHLLVLASRLAEPPPMCA